MGKAAILRIGTAVPGEPVPQAVIGNWMQTSFAHDPPLARWLGLIYARSGINFRHTCLPGLAVSPETAERFAPGRPPQSSPTTADRMALYRQFAAGLGLQAARQVVDDPDQITHVIAISCTGFYAPGLDIALVTGLGLRPDVHRTLVGFMGCAAGINGLRLAAEIVAGAPTARVLVVSVELCTLHIQPTRDREALIASSLFADGASAAVVGRPQGDEPALFTLDGFRSHLTPDTSDAMVWDIGDHGFSLRLSPTVPTHVAASAPLHVQELFGDRSPAFFAIHPGGKAIVDKIASSFALDAQATSASRAVLAQYGNISSATILFVLKQLATDLSQRESASVCPLGVAMAFGPGLVTELAALTFISRTVGREREVQLGDLVGVS